MFGSEKPLALEIGCGVGDFTLSMAMMHPELNFIAIDYYNKGCLKTCGKIDKAGIDNVLVVRDEAVSFLSRAIPESSLHLVVINCPDPWPKKRHRKRRLVNRSFMQLLSGFMAQGAEFHFATDFDDYAEDVAGFMPELSCFRNMFDPHPYLHAVENYPLSKYMIKFMAEGKRIFFLRYRKI